MKGEGESVYVTGRLSPAVHPLRPLPLTSLYSSELTVRRVVQLLARRTHTAAIHLHEARQASTLARVATDGGEGVLAGTEGLGAGAVDVLVRRAAAHLARSGALSLNREERALAEAGVGGSVVG